MTERIFISYARKDELLARRLHTHLQAQKFTVWMDVFNISPGDDWNAEIDRGLQRSNIIVVLLTPDSVKSKQVTSEWMVAVEDENKTVIPLLVVDCKIPRLLKALQWIDCRADFDTGVNQLVEQIKKISKGRGRTPAQPKTEPKSPKPKSVTQQPRPPQPAPTPEVEKIRILIVDDHNTVRKGLLILLEVFDDFEVVGEVNNGKSGVDFCWGECPDVVLMDMIMPVMDGITATRLVREACPDTQILAFTSFSDEETVQEVLKAGAIGYIMKDVSADELASAIRRAYSGKPTLSPEAAQALISATTRPPSIGHDLTERELEVLALMVEGLNNREIGERLGISSATVKNHVSNILSKMEIVSRTQAIVLAVEHKILDKYM